MTPVETSQILEDVFVVQDDFVNVYFIKGTDGYIATDAGNDPRVVTEELKKLEIDPAHVKAVLLTHSDYDHVNAIDIYKNATVFISSAEEQLIDGSTGRILGMSNTLECEYTLLEDNQEIELCGLPVKCLLTPGHTSGSMCYLINGKYLFTGDCMSLSDGKVELFNNFFNMDSDIQRKSLQMLTSVENVDYLFTAHYGYTDDFHNAMSEFR
jgi:glyoxylase-like metal-dependent hydrolase (beta-lactamase superfamily II)